MKIVQVGANCGYDHLSEYVILNFNSNPEDVELHLIEPNPMVLDSLKKCYEKFPNAVIHNIAIKTPYQYETEIDIFYYEDDVVWQNCTYGKASTKVTHLEKHRGQPGCKKNIKSFTAKCKTLDDFLIDLNLFDIDLLCIDAEGMDGEIILTFDWKKYSIKKVQFEFLHLEYYGDAISNMFLGMGYHRVRSGNDNDWAFEK